METINDTEESPPIFGLVKTELSVVATIYRSAELVAPLVEEIVEELERMQLPFEVILVDDCSPDNSWEIVKEAVAKDNRIRAIRLRKNRGQQIAASAALSQASGRYIVLMDGDLQNPTDAIPLMYDQIRREIDIVYTVDNTRNNWIDGLTSWLFWNVLTRICGVRLVKHQLMLRMMRREIVQEYCRYGENVRTVAGVLNDITSSYSVVNVRNRRRPSGRSNYSLLRRLDLMLEVFISLTTAPLNIILGLSSVVLIMTLLAMTYHFANYFLRDIQPGFTSILLLVSFFGSLSLIVMGFIGRYLAVIVSEVRRRPLYQIKHRLNIK